MLYHPGFCGAPPASLRLPPPPSPRSFPALTHVVLAMRAAPLPAPWHPVHVLLFGLHTRTMWWEWRDIVAGMGAISSRSLPSTAEHPTLSV